MKCPVCKHELSSGTAKCPTCGFADLSHNFINTEDAVTWFELSVVPYRLRWEQSQSQARQLTADELYAQIAAAQNKGILNYVNDSAADFEYVDYEGGIEITRYNGSAETVRVPDAINGKPVYRLGVSLFENCDWITNVTLPSSLRSIGSRAFKDCGVTRLVLPDTISEIGEEAFRWSKLMEIVFPKQVKTIPKSVCSLCCKLKTVVILGATSIGNCAFNHCPIEKLVLPDTLQNIGQRAFGSLLKEIILPISVQSLHGNSFDVVDGSIIVLNDNLEWLAPDKVGTVFCNERATIYCNPGSTSQQYARKHGIKMKPLSEYKPSNGT